MPPLHHDHFVTGPFTRKGGKLIFTAEGQTAYDARHAKEAGKDFTVYLAAQVPHSLAQGVARRALGAPKG